MKAFFIFIGLIVVARLADATVQVATNQYRPDYLYVKTYSLNQSVSGEEQTTANGSPSTMKFNYSFGCTYQDGNGVASYNGADSLQFNNWTGFGGFGQHSESIVESGPLYISTPQTLNVLDMFFVAASTLWVNSNSYIQKYQVDNGYPVMYTNVNMSFPYTSSFTGGNLFCENANISDFGFTGGVPYGTSINQTANRTATTIIRLKTGGQSASRARHLFQFYPAYNYPATAAIPYAPYMYSPIDPYALFWQPPFLTSNVPPQNVSIGNYGHMDSNDVLSQVLFDNADVVVTPTTSASDYLLGLYEQKFQASIQVNGVNLMVGAVVSNANFCVGQGLDFSLKWSPITPADLPESGIQWSFQGTFVNSNPPAKFGDGCSDYYFEDTNLLKLASTRGWWTSGGYNPPAIYEATLTRTFNGIPLSYQGLFSIHRPRLIDYGLLPSPDNPSLGSGSLEHDHAFGQTPDDFLCYGGPIGIGLQPAYAVDIDCSTNFGGSAYITQLVNGFETNATSALTTGGSNWLDNVEIYPVPYSQPVPVVGGSYNQVILTDTPYTPCASNSAQNLSFTDYIRFAPGGGIYVTLGTINWNVVDSTHLDPTNDDYVPELTSSATDTNFPYVIPTGSGHTDASPSGANSFPYWEHTSRNNH